MAEAIIYDATLSPTKDELVSAHSPIVELLGSYRVVDRNGEVGIEVLIGRDVNGALRQFGVSYRDAGAKLDDELTPMDHSVLGARSVAALTTDPVAVRELIQTILTGGEGASFSNGAPIFAVRGTGQTSDVAVGAVEIEDHNEYTSIGSVDIDGEQQRYQLRITREILDARVAEPEDLALVRADDGVILMRLEVWK
ncbi:MULTISPECIES: CG0192 family protein [Corynebacterium]|uniref:Maltokinase N-terminal cap domain-containing protein n=1 Tax=Corynebacterium ihumii TaxID=1232427 RepID=A0ABY7UEU6_9CORY|nr:MULTISPECIES: hypothetical protein [Corynebacterium]WCZ35212.1 hypothetical protein CIHUM_09085 [Corynebacterium ihumii]